MPWGKKKKYNVSNTNKSSKELNIGTYIKKIETKSNVSSSSSKNTGLISSLPKQANTKKLHQIL